MGKGVFFFLFFFSFSSFLFFFFKLVKEAGGKATRRISTELEDRIDVVMSAVAPWVPNDIVIQTCKQQKLDLVTTEWLAHTLISNKIQDGRLFSAVEAQEKLRDEIQTPTTTPTKKEKKKKKPKKKVVEKKQMKPVKKRKRKEPESNQKTKK